MAASMLKGHTDSVNYLSLNSTGSVLLSASEDSSCRLWDLRSSGRTIQALKGFSGEGVNCVIFHPLNENWVYASSDRSVFGFDLRMHNNKVVVSSSDLAWCVNTDEINQIAISPNKSQSHLLAACDDAGEVRILNITDGNLFKTLKGVHTNIVSAVQFRPKAAWEVSTAGLDTTQAVWDFSKGRTTHSFQHGAINTGQCVNPPLVHSLVYSPDGKSVISGCGDATISILKVAGRVMKKTKIRNAHGAAVNQVAFALKSDGKYFHSVGNDNRIRSWDFEKAAVDPKASSVVHDATDCLQRSITHDSGINWIAVSQENYFVADVTKNISIYSLN